MVKKKNIFWFSIFMVIILAVLVFVIYNLKSVSDDKENNYIVNGTEYQIDKEKILDIDIYNIHIFSDGIEYVYPFRNHPADLEQILMGENLTDKLNRPNGIKTLWVTRDVNLGPTTRNMDVVAAAAFEQILGTNQAGLYKLNIKNTYTTFYREGLATINCDDVDNNEAVIYIKLGLDTKVYSENDCIIIQGTNSTTLIQASEKFVP